MTTEAATTYDKLTANGKAFMEMVGLRQTDFFDNGIEEGSGNWGSNLADDLAAKLGKSPKSSAGIMVATAKAGLWDVRDDEEGDYGQWWDLTALGAEVAKHAAIVATAPVTVEDAAPVAVKVCKKDASHGEHRVTRTGSYCKACDTIAYEASKAAKAAK